MKKQNYACTVNIILLYCEKLSYFNDDDNFTET